MEINILSKVSLRAYFLSSESFMCGQAAQGDA